MKACTRQIISGLNNIGNYSFYFIYLCIYIYIYITLEYSILRNKYFLLGLKLYCNNSFNIPNSKTYPIIIKDCNLGVPTDPAACHNPNYLKND